MFFWTNMVTKNKYFEIINKTVVDYVEKKINLEELIEKFDKLEDVGVYKNLEKDGYIGLCNFVSAIQELSYPNNPDASWIISSIDDFYAYFTNNFSHIYGATFYKYLKFGLQTENNNPVEISFNRALSDYFDKKITHDCLGFIAKEFLNDLKYFQKEINSNPKLLAKLTTASKLSFNKILESLTPEEKKLKQEINEELSKGL